MPPKKKVVADAGAESSASGTAAGGDAAKSTMPQGDIDFIMAALQHVTGGTVNVDVQKIAEALSYKNPRSVNNKLAAIRTKYSIPLHSGSGGAKSSGPASADDANVPKTSTEAKVTKAKAPAKAKAKAAPKKAPAKKAAAKSKKNVKAEEDAEEDAVKNESDLSEVESDAVKAEDDIEDRKKTIAELEQQILGRKLPSDEELKDLQG